MLTIGNSISFLDLRCCQQTSLGQECTPKVCLERVFAASQYLRSMVFHQFFSIRYSEQRASNSISIRSSFAVDPRHPIRMSDAYRNMGGLRKHYYAILSAALWCKVRSLCLVPSCDSRSDYPEKDFQLSCGTVFEEEDTVGKRWSRLQSSSTQFL